ncbi:uncharacterized protein BDR25DRAFT_307483 [Lindgomyces ingoldianus]|uniref:Uncharacterized protein n=1 Tax=Lindgomyces ingoldianus TaxID=673940 RepID=A0ACB6QAJ2_9PLEO|nr:uncharacterized protein BDR25DRAFT_307483 [Lindgomyces ingoldianus]KAF2463944.1 hypothetical protein BDR25DRAFT_307483 [Lindgomyces ingoldianus]
MEDEHHNADLTEGSNVQASRQEGTEDDVEEMEEHPEMDELSPDVGHSRNRRIHSALDVHYVSTAKKESDDNRESEAGEDPAVPARPVQNPEQPHPAGNGSKSTKATRNGSWKRKGRRPTQLINVLRINGLRNNSITAADSTRSLVEEILLGEINKDAEKVSRVTNPARRKQLKTKIMHTLSYSEALGERLMVLQDANDSLVGSSLRLKKFKKQKLDKRREYLAIQRERQELAVKMDQIREHHFYEKAAFDAQNELSNSIFDIQMAIRSGRKQAQHQGREDEGPYAPLKMVLENVAKNVDSGGLLASAKSFNRILERAASFLEGRA